MIRGRHGDCSGIQYILVATQQGREPGVSGVRQNLVEPRLFDWVPRFPSRTLLLAVAMAVGLAIMSTTGTLRIADAEQASSRPCANGVAGPRSREQPRPRIRLRGAPGVRRRPGWPRDTRLVGRYSHNRVGGGRSGRDAEPRYTLVPEGQATHGPHTGVFGAPHKLEPSTARRQRFKRGDAGRGGQSLYADCPGSLEESVDRDGPARVWQPRQPASAVLVGERG